MRTPQRVMVFGMPRISAPMSVFRTLKAAAQKPTEVTGKEGAIED
jgi:hypothetical protein